MSFIRGFLSISSLIDQIKKTKKEGPELHFVGQRFLWEIPTK